MFEYVQEREIGKRLEPRTIVYVITVGEYRGLNSQKLTERGENQLLEMARSRVATGVRILYSATDKVSGKSAEILAKEFESKVQKMDCLDMVKFGDKSGITKEELEKMWQNEEYQPKNGESLAEVRERFGTCMGSIVANHQDDVFAVVVDPFLAVLFYTHIAAAPLDVNEWYSAGYAACATYEYSRGWSVVMPSDNSYLSEPTTVGDSLSDEMT
ncbi:MAG: histidine phosphatase family protein [Candidatus Thorarchaeota archaeon]|nr:histidine phosphatase family protein [Candidatus Thorarchaeota archaeon]